MRMRNRFSLPERNEEELFAIPRRLRMRGRELTYACENKKRQKTSPKCPSHARPSVSGITKDINYCELRNCAGKSKKIATRRTVPSLISGISLTRHLLLTDVRVILIPRKQIFRRSLPTMKSTIALVIIAAMLTATVTAQDDYIHLPGKSCQDAPPCPDGRPCVMAPPRCNVGTCGANPVPTCGRKP